MNSKALPPYLMTSDEGSFAQKTIAERKPSIINQILADYDYTSEIRQSLIDYKHEIASSQINKLQEDTSDKTVWDQALQPWEGKTWFEIPWLLAEAYFYRRVLEATCYFQPGPYNGMDPFQRLKTQEIFDGQLIFEKIYPSLEKTPTLESLQALCIKALWGNRGDLSHTQDKLDPSMETQSDRIILDNTSQAYQYLNSKQPASIAYFFDNVGKELFFDLALIDFLLNSGFAGKVTCYLKNQPFFVSDAMPKDFFATIDTLTTSKSDIVQQMAKSLQECIKKGTMIIDAPPFFTQPEMYDELPDVLRNQISAHDLAILKGDVNYRRLMGDRHWSATTPVVVAGGYFPASFLSLRTLKAELVVGLTDKNLEKIKNEADPDWLINGKRGVITFLQK